MRKAWIALTMCATFVASPCIAEYIAIGPYEGDVCTGFVIKACSLERLDAVKKGGQFYEINKAWDNVDEYNNGRCSISFGRGAFGFADKPPQFYQYDENKTLHPVVVNSYITFKCQKR